MSFIESLNAAWSRTQSLLCVGLDRYAQALRNLGDLIVARMQPLQIDLASVSRASSLVSSHWLNLIVKGRHVRARNFICPITTPRTDEIPYSNANLLSVRNRTKRGVERIL